MVLVVVGMISLSFASVPLYNIFCKLTGFAGTTMVAKKSANRVGTKNITVTFDANVDSDLPWNFVAKQREIKVKTGENAIAFYQAENYSSKDIIGTAVYNVTPHQAAKYFNKIQCFCFEEQLLKSGEKQMMPVTFFIDPDIENDKFLSNVNTITLSYSFYKIPE
jgi:cytochrome c oxidase assembly protein subunit 11